jgi:hypothetical protein
MAAIADTYSETKKAQASTINSKTRSSGKN